MFKNLDAFGKIGILACILLFGYSMYSNGERAKLKAELSNQEVEAAAGLVEAELETQGESPGVVVENTPIESELFTVENDQAIYTYTSNGGSIANVAFKGQQQVVERDLLVEFNQDSLFGIGTIFDGASSKVTTQFTGVEGDDGIVSFEGQLNKEVKILKVFTPVKEGDGQGYRTKVTYSFVNLTDQPIRVSDLYLYMGTVTPLHADELIQSAGYFWYDKGFKFKGRNTFNGGFFKSEKKRVSEDVDRLEYFGVANQFFTSVALVDWKENVQIRSSARKEKLFKGTDDGDYKEVNLVDVSAEIPQFTIPAGGSHPLSFELYTGPKEAKTLKEANPKLGKLMNYGFFGWLSPLLNWILNTIEIVWEKIVDPSYAWGLSIIALTLMVRLALWPLHRASITSMKRMSKLNPLMQKMREKYADDPQKMQIETMGLYKKYGVNPLSGCLPMLIQMPIFLGFFSMLRSASELRGQKFLWVQDLSLPDTMFEIPILGGIDFNLLPILMAGTSFVQMSIMPQQAPTNPNMPDMRLIMKFMPLMFLAFCYDYASALALYWTTTNLFSIFQTWYMRRIPEPELKEVAQKQANKKPGFFDKMKEQMEEAKQLQEQQNRKQRGLKDAKPKKRSPKTGG